MLSIAFCASAQQGTTYERKALTNLAKGQVLDTVLNATPVYLTSARIGKAYSTLNVVYTATEISGTTSGTATLEASEDGVLWYPIYNSADTSYSFSMTDVATVQNYRWKISNWSDNYVRIKVVGGSTVNFQIKGTVSGKK